MYSVVIFTDISNRKKEINILKNYLLNLFPHPQKEHIPDCSCKDVFIHTGFDEWHKILVNKN